MDDMISTTSATAPVQTEENTLAPHEALPPKKTRGFTKEMRDAKIAAGWIPPEARPKPVKVAAPVATVAAPVSHLPTEAQTLLKALVDKLVAIENDPQYRSVWTHFFVHGGVYIGPKYIDELNDAIQYLIGIESAKTSMG